MPIGIKKKRLVKSNQYGFRLKLNKKEIEIRILVKSNQYGFRLNFLEVSPTRQKG